MADPLLAAGVVVLVGLIPTYIGLLFLMLARRAIRETSGWIYASIASGIVLALFFDLVGEASGLGLNLGVRAPVTLVLLVSSFVFGVLLLFGLESKSRKGRDDHLFPVSFAYLIALGVGFHSIAEGIIIGYDINTAGVSEEIGGILQGLSFALHKAGEGFVIGALFFKSLHWRDFLGTGFLAAFPGVIGATLGIIGMSGIVGSYFFAMGAGASIYMLSKLMPVAVSGSRGLPTAIGFALGYLFIFGAGIIHTL